MSKSLPYIILREKRVIRVYHGDLDKSWWDRGKSFYERDAECIESVIRQITGLRRVYRRHGRSHVDFVIGNQEKFNAASVALRLQFQQTDKHTESFLARQ